LNPGVEVGAAPERLTRKCMAERFGIGMGTLLYYERIGLLPQPVRGANGYRLYSEAEVDRMTLIAEVKGLGFKLREIAAVFEGIAADSIGSGPGREALRAGLLEKAEELRREIEALESRRRRLLDIAASPRLGDCGSIRAVARGPSRV
jgi:DNA-binding transcriptional MerR regulator